MYTVVRQSNVPKLLTKTTNILFRQRAVGLAVSSIFVLLSPVPPSCRFSIFQSFNPPSDFQTPQTTPAFPSLYPPLSLVPASPKLSHQSIHYQYLIHSTNFSLRIPSICSAKTHRDRMTTPLTGIMLLLVFPTVTSTACYLRIVITHVDQCFDLMKCHVVCLSCVLS